MKKALKILLIVIGSIAVLAVSGMLITGISPLSFGWHSEVYEKGGAALDGYDVVSYFSGSPVKGNEDYALDWNGSHWLFATAANAETFKASPEKYVPQFGGYCAFAVSTGFAAPANPAVWTIHEEKLFIFSDESVKEKFQNNPDAIINACASSW